jgi:hypothetical protein
MRQHGEMDTADAKRYAVYLARGRAVLGLAATTLPGVVGPLMMGRTARTPAGRAFARMLGVRDIALGVGAITALNESDHGPEWVSMGAVADAVDGVAMLATPGLPRWVRPFGLVAVGLAGAQLVLSRQLADARDAASPRVPPEVPPRPLDVPAVEAAGR